MCLYNSVGEDFRAAQRGFDYGLPIWAGCQIRKVWMWVCVYINQCVNQQRHISNKSIFLGCSCSPYVSVWCRCQLANEHSDRMACWFVRKSARSKVDKEHGRITWVRMLTEFFWALHGWDFSQSSKPGTKSTKAKMKWRRQGLTFTVLVREPMVLHVLIFKIRIPLPALLLSEIFILFRTIMSVAKLELIAWSKTRATSVSWAGYKKK